VADTAICVVREVEDHVREKATAEKEANGQPDEKRPVSGRDGSAPSVLCIAGRTELDRAATEMMAQALDERGIGTRVLPPIAVSQGALGQLDLQGVDVVCLSYLHPQPQVFARYICRRLRRRVPHVKLVVCCWNLAPGAGRTEDPARQMAADAMFASLEGCVDQVVAWSTSRSSPAGPPPVTIDTEQAQMAALRELGLAAARERRFDDVSREVAHAFDVPIALVSFIDEIHRADPHGHEPPEAQASGRAPHEKTLDAHVVAADEVLVSNDVTEDPRFADDPLVLEKGIRFYAGAPMRTAAGIAIGSLSVIDTKPREFTEADRRLLQQFSDRLMARIERRSSENAGASRADPLSADARPGKS
jgi:GAF domain-containing protein